MNKVKITFSNQKLHSIHTIEYIDQKLIPSVGDTIKIDKKEFIVMKVIWDYNDKGKSTEIIIVIKDLRDGL
jgi:hypothetical protein